MRRALVAVVLLLGLGLLVAFPVLAQEETSTTTTSSSSTLVTTATTEPPTTPTTAEPTTTRRATTTTRRRATTTTRRKGSTTTTSSTTTVPPPPQPGETTTTSSTVPPTTAGFQPPPGRNPRNPNTQVQPRGEGGDRLLPLAVGTSLVGLACAGALLGVQWLRTRRLGRPDLPELHLPRLRFRRS